jgi:RNA methyltransferase, TrmH family
MQTITSRDNPLLRQARAVRDGKTDDLIFIEGLRLSEEALRSGLTIASVIVADELARKERARELIHKLEATTDRAAVVSEKLLESISYTSTPQGIVVLAARPDTGEKQLDDNMKNPALVVVMHRINNPVNVGAILRTAEAAGATAAIATRESSDPFSPKSLRGAMGSAFRLPIWRGPTYESVIAWCNARSIATVCAELQASSRHDEVDWRRASALILGPESQGLSPEEIALADQSIRIPMKGEAESLNVAVAAGVLLYEAARQRDL